MQAIKASDDGSLLAVAREYENFAVAFAALCASENADPVEEESIAAYGYRIGSASAALPATTIAGFQAKLQIVATLLGWDGTSATEQVAAASSVNEAVSWSILRDLPAFLHALSARPPLAD